MIQKVSWNVFWFMSIGFFQKYCVCVDFFYWNKLKIIFVNWRKSSWIEENFRELKKIFVNWKLFSWIEENFRIFWKFQNPKDILFEVDRSRFDRKMSDLTRICQIWHKNVKSFIWKKSSNIQYNFKIIHF